MAKLTEAEIAKGANGSSFDKGYSYYRNGYVLEITQRGEQITAEVEGSAYQPYQVQATVQEGKISSVNCSCPYDWGGYCKHIVAALLHYVHEPSGVEQQQPLADLLADLTAEQLKQLIIQAADANLDFLRAIERELQWLKVLPTKHETAAPVASQVDVTAVKRHIRQGMRNIGPKGYDDYYYYEEGGADEELYQILDPYLEQTLALLVGGQVEEAAVLITAVLDAFCDNLDLIEEFYEYTEGMYEGDTDLIKALTEVILSHELTGKTRQEWQRKVKGWQNILGELKMAETAVTQGWDYAPLRSVLQGNITNKGAWADEAPWFADELAQIRLNVLERQGRIQEAIYLAEAEGQIERYIHLLVQTGQIEQAVKEANQYFHQARQALALAQRLQEMGEQTAALTVAEKGLTLEDHWQHEKGKLGRWLRQVAQSAGKNELALQAAQIAVLSTHELADFTAVQQLAGDQWDKLQPQLLDAIEASNYSSAKLDILVQAGRLTAVMRAIDKNYRYHTGDLLRMLVPTKDKYPDWGIQKCKNLAEAIMDAGRSKDYDTAVNWLRRAKEIYLHHQRQAEWYSYVDGLLGQHGRKYKLVPMLKTIR
ncbi:SWIM zinc finger family protein [Candidatus Leptofilum sp.]|uniref:SWIM zinc finger family protein n=1 Tax=Candidatus Leptofilum sp. TaxID=3241576 RepID=UPI003B5A78F5